MQAGQVRFRYPTQDNILFHGWSEVIAGEAPHDPRQHACLPGGEISQRQRDGGHSVSRLPMTVDIRPIPVIKALGTFLPVERAAVAGWLLRVGLRTLEIAGPARIHRHRLTLFKDDSAEFLDAQLRDQKFDSSRRPVLLFSQSRENSGNGLRNRKQFVFRYERIKELRLMGHRTQAAANVKLEAA